MISLDNSFSIDMRWRQSSIGGQFMWAIIPFDRTNYFPFVFVRRVIQYQIFSRDFHKNIVSIYFYLIWVIDWYSISCNWGSDCIYKFVPLNYRISGNNVFTYHHCKLLNIFCASEQQYIKYQIKILLNFMWNRIRLKDHK